MFKDPQLREYLQYLSLGAEIAAGLSVPILIGYWLDTRWDTSPWMLLAGALVGIAVLISISFRIMRNMQNDQK